MIYINNGTIQYFLRVVQISAQIYKMIYRVEMDETQMHHLSPHNLKKIFLEGILGFHQKTRQFNIEFLDA